jgi:hypothetical protein
MLVTETMIRAAQIDVTRLASECQNQDAFSVSEAQVVRASEGVFQEQAAIRNIAGSVWTQIYRNLRLTFLKMRLAIASLSDTSQITETLLGFCAAVLIVICEFILLGALGASAWVGMVIACGSLAIFLVTTGLILRYLPPTAAAHAIEIAAADRDARTAAIAGAECTELIKAATGLPMKHGHGEDQSPIRSNIIETCMQASTASTPSGSTAALWLW